jgi:diguanylate cyclase (GGDEF)-like protein
MQTAVRPGPESWSAPPAAAPAAPLHRLHGLARDLWWGRAEDQLASDAGHGATPARWLTLGIIVALLGVPAGAAWVDRSHALAPALLPLGAIALGAEAISFLWERRLARTTLLVAAKLGLFAAVVGACWWVFLAADDPVSYTRQSLMFLVFVLYIGAAGLRNDPRLPLCAGVFAALALFAVSLSVPGIAAASPAVKAEALRRDFDFESQLGRSMILLCATAIAVTSAARGRAIRRLSVRDGLTGLVNRLAFDAFLLSEGARARRAGHPFAIAMLDVDHFKRLNDERGHAAGDEVLRWIADLLRAEYRATDLLARYGGDEFALVFVEAQGTNLRARLEALRARVAAGRRELGDGRESPRITLSIGLASWPADGESAAEVLACADARLYTAKRAGRNRLVADDGAQ